MKNVFLTAGLISLFSISAYAQNPVLQSGTVTGHHAAMWTAQGVIQDAGPKTGGGPNVGISDLPLLGVGTPLCIYDAPVTNSLGYHFLCAGANDGNKGLISFGAGGAAAQIPFQLCANGSCFEFPFTGTGAGNVMGAPPTGMNDVTCFNNTVGTLIKSCGGLTGNSAGALTATATISAAQYNLTTVAFATRAGNSHTLYDYDGAAAIVMYGAANGNFNYFIGDTHVWQNNAGAQMASLSGVGLFQTNAVTTNANIQSTGGNIVACASPCETTLTTTGNIVGTGSVTGSFVGSTGSIHAGTTINTAQYNLRGAMFAEMDSTATRTALYDPGANQGLVMYANGFNYYQNSQHQFKDRTAVSGTTFAIFNANGTFNVGGLAWQNISDDNVKENVAPYTAGLDKLITLNPVSYSYAQLPNTRANPNPFSSGTAGKTYYGLMASNVKPALPEMTGTTTFMTATGTPTPPVDTIAPGHLTYVMINAIKEMNTRLIAVETAAGVQKK